MVQVSFEIPDHLVGQFYIAVGKVLKQAQPGDGVDEPDEPLHDWGTMAFDDETAYRVWRKFSPKAQAVFSLLIDNAGIAMSADDIAAKVGLASGRHGLAGIVAWPTRMCAEVGRAAPFRFENPVASGETGSYWMDPETAQLFAAARQLPLTKQAAR